MTASPTHRPSPEQTAAPDARVTTLIACAGVRPLTRQDNGGGMMVANENRWFDQLGFRRRWYANIAGALVAIALLAAGYWIVTEFTRLQKIAECFEAGRQHCMPLDMARKGR